MKENQQVVNTDINAIISLQDAVILWVYDYYNMPQEDRFPEIVINSGAYYYCGDDCEDLIVDCAKFISLSVDSLYSMSPFPYDTYFEPEPSPFTGLYFILLSPVLVPILMYYICQSIFCWIFRIKLEKYRFSKTDKALLTARHFADIMIEILDVERKEQFLLMQQIENMSYEQRAEWRNKFYQLVIESDPKKYSDFSPDMIINKGDFAISWWKRKKLIKNCEKLFHLKKGNFYDLCNQKNYINFVPSIMVIVLYSIAKVISFIVCCFYYLIKKKWIFRLQHELKPLTAKELADILIAQILLERIWREQKFSWL